MTTVHFSQLGLYSLTFKLKHQTLRVPCNSVVIGFCFIWWKTIASLLSIFVDRDIASVLTAVQYKDDKTPAHCGQEEVCRAAHTGLEITYKLYVNTPDAKLVHLIFF